MKLYIKYMVSIRCQMVVKAALEQLGIPYRKVDLGEADIQDEITTEQLSQLKINLLKSGLVLMDDKKAILIDRIKSLIVEMVHYADELPKEKNSVYISKKLNHNYNYLSTLFSDTTGITIENYLIAHKIERVKELLIYDELTLTQIADKLHYSSVAHLSNQFKKITGLTTSYFKQLKDKKRTTLEDV